MTSTPGAPAVSGGGAVAPAAVRGFLLLRLGRGSYALPLSDVGGLADCGPLRALPGAPATVLGLSGWRGSLLVVLDLPRLLGDSATGHEPCLVRLAPPRQQLALHVPGAVRVVTAPPPGLDARHPTLRVEEIDCELLRPQHLLERLDEEIAAVRTPDFGSGR